jgi:membrane-bound lytic murein transglycosylase A
MSPAISPHTMSRVRRAGLRNAISILGGALLLAACVTGRPPGAPVEPAPAPSAEAGDALYLTPASYEQVPGWAEDPMSAALPALLRSCQKLVEKAPETPVGPNGIAGSVADWIPVCNTAWGLTPSDDIDMRAFMMRWFRPYLVSDADGADGLFTGYYEPELYGSLTQSPQYSVPLYRVPDDMATVPLGPFRADLEGESIVGRVDGTRFVPYYSHQEIDMGALAGRGLELLYVDDPVAAFFLHIQGSGRVFLDDGTEMRVGYAGKNGRPYVAIGRVLADRGEIPLEQVSLQSIRAWLDANPDRAREVMYQNPSFIFFQPIDGDGPIGAQGAVLTPSRSIAVDTRLLPLGAPIFVDTIWPAGPDQGSAMRRLMIAQDTGGAIRGAVRGDVYWGSGDIAGEYAGAMKSPGRYYLLLPASVAERRAQAS